MWITMPQGFFPLPFSASLASLCAFWPMENRKKRVPSRVDRAWAALQSRGGCCLRPAPRCQPHPAHAPSLSRMLRALGAWPTLRTGRRCTFAVHPLRAFYVCTSVEIWKGDSCRSCWKRGQGHCEEEVGRCEPQASHCHPGRSVAVIHEALDSAGVLCLVAASPGREAGLAGAACMGAAAALSSSPQTGGRGGRPDPVSLTVGVTWTRSCRGSASVWFCPESVLVLPGSWPP